MKKIFATAILFAFGITANAQVDQKQVTKESTTKTVTVNNGETKRKISKTERTEAVQDVELKDAESNKLNKDIKQTPVKVQKTTTISGTGIPTQQIGSSTYYQYDGQNYRFMTDASGFQISSPDDKEYGVLRKLSNGTYIYRTSDKVSVGHFDDNGNFVVETYDDKNDRIMVETYTKVQK